MKWNPELYDSKHGFVSQYGKALLAELDLTPGRVILDLGCGTGKLSGNLASAGATVIGVDSSPEMVEKARSSCPALEFIVADATKLPFSGRFDIIFSNAVFHWIPDQDALLSSVFRALKPGGLLLCEFGGERNTHRILDAFQEEFQRLGRPFQNPFFYPSTGAYHKLLRSHGFEIEFVRDFDRPTPLTDGPQGLRNWLNQFYASSLSLLSPREQELLFSRIETRLRPELWDGAQWVADYRRIQAKAKKPA